METILTEQELSVLRAIANDKFAAGAFSGMIFNALKDAPIQENTRDEHIDLYIKLALDIRLRITELTK